jgi:hypothetical protein
MLEILQYIFSGFWTFIGTCILLGIILDVIIVNIFITINNFIKYRCAYKLSKDGMSAEEIDNLLGDKKENKDEK